MFPAPSYSRGARLVAGRYNLHPSSRALIAPAQKLWKIFATESKKKKKQKKKPKPFLL